MKADDFRFNGSFTSNGFYKHYVITYLKGVLTIHIYTRNVLRKKILYFLTNCNLAINGIPLIFQMLYRLTKKNFKKSTISMKLRTERFFFYIKQNRVYLKIELSEF